MAQQDYRANLASKGFPFLPRNRGRTVIIPGPDQIYSRYGSPAERNQDIGIPQIMGGHNFLPTAEGYQTIQPYWVNYDTTYKLNDGTIAMKFRRTISGLSSIETSEGLTIALEKPDVNFYPREYWSSLSGPVILGAAIAGNYSAESIQYADLSGTLYVYHRGTGTFTLSTVGALTFTPQVTSGLAADIQGILSSNGYLIAYNSSSVAWCSTTNPLDFVPSLVTGAGGGSIQEARGDILFCLPTSFGFIIYAQHNCVSATYTGNSRYPFSFKEISGSGGGISRNLVAFDPVRATHIAYTKFGMQELTRDSATNILPELADFINAGFYEEFDVSSWAFVLYKNGGARPGKLKLIANRYLIYSYRVEATSNADSDLPASGTNIAEHPVFTHALIYDLQYERWGKVKINHTDCFFFDDWHEPLSIYRRELVGGTNSYVEDYSYLGDIFKKYQGSCKFAFLQPGGQIYAFTSEATPTLSSNAADCCMVFGRFQYARSRRLCIDEIAVERPVIAINEDPLPSNSIELRVLESDDGRNISRVTEGYLATDTAELGVWNFSCDAFNYLIAIAGHVNINTLLLKYHLGGEA